MLIGLGHIILIRKVTTSNIRAAKSKWNVSRRCCINTLWSSICLYLLCFIDISSNSHRIAAAQSMDSWDLSLSTTKEDYTPTLCPWHTHKHTHTHTLQCTVITESLFLSCKLRPKGLRPRSLAVLMTFQRERHSLLQERPWSCNIIRAHLGEPHEQTCCPAPGGYPFQPCWSLPLHLCQHALQRVLIVLSILGYNWPEKLLTDTANYSTQLPHLTFLTSDSASSIVLQWLCSQDYNRYKHKGLTR